MKTSNRRRRRAPRRLRTRDQAPDLDLRRDLEELLRAIAPFELSISTEAATRLLQFSTELLAWNNRSNLLSRPDAPNVVRKHVAASLGVLLVARPNRISRWIDVGTGAGFPGMVLKIVRPEADIALLDSSHKRCLFLETVSRQIGLRNLMLVQKRAETYLLDESNVGAFDVVTARAVASLEDCLLQFGPLVTPGGRFITFKGPNWIEDLISSKSCPAVEEGVFALEAATRVPWTQGHILTFRKAGL